MPALGLLGALTLLSLIVVTVPILWPLLLLLLPLLALVLVLSLHIALWGLGDRMRRCSLSDRHWDALAVGLGLVLVAGIAVLASL